MLFSNKKAVKVFALLLISSFALSVVPFFAEAHTPPRTVHTYAYIALSPNPVGVGQQVIVVMWVSPNPPTATGLAGDRWRNMTIAVTAPN
jgi:hypothetical membrane protein